MALRGCFYWMNGGDGFDTGDGEGDSSLGGESGYIPALNRAVLALGRLLE